MGRIGAWARQFCWSRWRPCWPVLLFLAGSLCSISIPAQQADDQLELMKQLNGVTLDRAEVYAIRKGRITRDRMTLYFTHGFFAFLTKTGGEVTGAVFSGEGEILMIPPTQVEKRNLAQFTQAPVLEEKFSSVYMRFTDQTANELKAALRKPDPDDPEQPDQFLESWASLPPPDSEISARILEDLLGDRSRPYFFARLQGENQGIFEIVDDERQVEAFSVGSIRKTDAGVFTDVWCSFPTKTSQAVGVGAAAGPAKVLAYTIDIRIHPDHSLDGRAELQLESRSSKDRIIPFVLSHWLVLTGVVDERGRSLTMVADVARGGPLVGTRTHDQIAVTLPEPHSAGERFRLTFNYHGNVIADVGNGVLYVGVRGGWYPHIDAGLPARYDLTFHSPEKLTLVATGARSTEKSVEGLAESHWHSDGVFRVAGFNLGPYISAQRRAGKTPVTVYATREAESSLEKQRTESIPDSVAAPGRRGRGVGSPDVMSKIPLPLTPSALLGTIAGVAADAVNCFSELFGPFPYPRLAISQAPGNFGQGWPELIYLPTLSFLPKVERDEMGFSRGGGDPLGPAFVAHEIAHQWWGNLLGWQTYHDQWLSEGLASYAAAIFISRQKDGSRQFRDLLHLHKTDLLAKTKEGRTIESGGPIWLGERLSTSLNPHGYSNIIYKKSCWVFHMLHGLMIDPTTGSDEQFFRMLRDFVSQYQGRSVSTDDFIHHAEKYMSMQMDLERNHKLDWFFSEWVYETGVPTYTFQSEIRTLGADKFIVQGSIVQSDVAKDFEMLVPVVAIYAREKRVNLGRVVVTDAGTRFKFTTTRKPLRVAIDEENVLALVH
jgi:hypothetical protein